MHNHTPSAYTAPWKCFFVFLFSPIKTFHFYRDGEDICTICNSNIRIPEVYYHPLIKVLYFLGGGLVGFTASKLPFLVTLISFMMICIFHHVVSSVILAFCQWTALDPVAPNVEHIHSVAKKDSIIKAVCISIGFALFFVCFKGM